MEPAPDRPPRITLQTRGAVLAGAGLALLIAGLWRVDGVLAALGLAAWCLLAMARLLARMNPAGLEVAMDCPVKVQAGVVFPLSITLINRRRWLDAFGVRIECQLAAQVDTGGRAAWVAAGSAADLELRVAIPGRTFVESHALRLISDFPFGLFEMRKVLEIPHRMWVFPKPLVPEMLGFSAGSMDSSDGSHIAVGEAPGEPCGMRPWRAGDSPRRIYWPATLRSLAKGAGLVVRETEPPGFRPKHCAVLFHSFGSDGGLIRPDRFERALSMAAGTLRHLRSQGMALRWMADFDDWKSRPLQSRGEINQCLERLACARRAMDTEAHDLESALAGIGDDEGLIVLSDMPVATWQSALPRNRPSIVTPCISERRRAGEGRR